MTSAHDSAQIALGKFYLHRWEGQVLVDWATSMLSQGYEAPAFVRLSEMEGVDRATQLDQFIRTCNEADIEVYENMELAIRAYIEDLRRRALAKEIDITAAFAQLRPLAYDNTSVVIPGLTELDEDFNLLDSNQPAFHHDGITLDNREEYLFRFFEDLKVEDGPWNQPEVATEKTPWFSTENEHAERYFEWVAIAIIALLYLIYVLATVVSFVW